MIVDTLYWLDQIRPTHRLLVGNKAYHLSLLQQQGYPVVPGFVVSAHVFRNFLEQMEWLQPLFTDLPDSSLRLDIENFQQLQAIAQHIRRALSAPGLDPDLQVALHRALARFRSSTVILRPSIALPASAPPSLIVDSHTSALFTSRICQAAEVAVELKHLWAELFGVRSLFYWQRCGILLPQVQFAVLVQPLLSASAAGTATVAGDRIEILSAAGLGMAVALGQVEPDRYQVNRLTGAIENQQLGNQTIAYQLATEEVEFGRSLSLNPLPSSTASRLHTQLLNPDRLYSLEAAALPPLIRLIQQLAVALGASLELEWLVSSDPQTPVWVTQVMVSSAKSSAVGKTRTEPRSIALQPLPKSNPTESNAAESASSSSLMLTGLAAAPGRAVAAAYVIAATDPLDAIPPGAVLVVATIPADGLSLIQQAAAIVTEQGGMTSHSAIIARELKVPAVMGVRNATQHIQTGDLIVVDGDRGRIYAVPDAASAQAPPAIPAPQPRFEHPPIETQLLVNLSQIDRLPAVAALPIQGIGLIRSELFAISLLEQQHPQVWIQQGRADELVSRFAAHIQEFAAAMQPRPIVYRSLDLRPHEFPSLSDGTPLAANPIVGLRGTFSYLLNPAVFDLELQALARVQQAGYENLYLLLPFVRSVEELRFCRQRVEQAGLMRCPQFQLWMMAEVPSVLFLLPDYAQAGVQGISIGTNDLTQLLLGVDRDHAQLSAAFDEQHPAVMRAIADLIQQARQSGLSCSLCGQAASRSPDFVEQLVRWGITSISVEPDAVEQTYAAIVRSEHARLQDAIDPTDR